MTDNAEPKAHFIISKIDHFYSKTPALKGINLNINEGEKVAIVGPSGSGKTTLLSMLNASLQPTQGQIIIQGKSSSQYTSKELKALRSKIALIPQNLALVGSFKV